MKKYIYWAFALPLLTGCDDMVEYGPPSGGSSSSIQETATSEMYILSEGLFQLNNSRLGRYSFVTQTWTPNWFYDMNRRDLGDTANDMERYGNRLYVVVNVSSTLEVIDLNSGKSVARISLLNEKGASRQPRSVAFSGSKAYVCSYDGTVARIDTASLTVDTLITVGRNPEDLCVQDGKLYVTNSGGLDWDGMGVDHTVSVVDLQQFREIKKIDVGPNPGKIQAGPDHRIYLTTYGKNIEEGDYHLVCIDTGRDEVLASYDVPVMDFAINDRLAYLYTYNYKNNSSAIQVFSLDQGRVIQEEFITDGTKLTTPYSIQVNPNSGNVYLTDAYNYQIMGDVLCFSPQGKLIYRLREVGMNPNTLVFCSDSHHPLPPSDVPEPEYEGYADTVYAYRPAPSQYMNTSITAYEDGDDEAAVLQRANALIRQPKQCLLSLGAWGGYLTLGFPKAVKNIPGDYDLQVLGNAYYDMYGTWQNRPGGNAEPGIVLVSCDVNANGIPDDPWYELAGSEYHNPEAIRNYQVTYYRENPGEDVRWTDNQGNSGWVKRNDYNSQTSYYPAWLPEKITFSGTRLPDNAVNEPREDMPEHWVGYAFDYGYADNHPNNTDGSKLKLEWAVDSLGNPVVLDSIHFVKIYTAVLQNCGWMGETSTEVQAVRDLNYADKSE